MRPAKDTAGRRARPSSPPRSARTTTTFPSGPHSSLPRSRQSTIAHSASLLDSELVTQEDNVALFEDLRIFPEHANSNPEPRSFPYSVKQQCWEKAEKVKGRDPDRWRRDPLGNIVFRKLVGCPGCLCHDYDHIVPYSKAASIISSSIQPLHMLSMLKYFEEKMGPDEALLWGQSCVEKGFLALERLLKDFAGRYATGEAVFMADVFLAPQIAVALMRFKIDMSKFPTLGRIYESCKGLPEFVGSLPQSQPDAEQ